MTPPMTPREKVAAAMIATGVNIGSSTWPDEIQVDALTLADAGIFSLASGSGDHADHSGEATNMVDHAELARLAEAATPGEWELDGHQCLSAPDGTIVVDYSCCGRGEWEANAAYLRAVQPSRVLSLLAEIAALRAAKWEVQHVDTMNDMVLMGMARDDAENRATEAERKLAEAERAAEFIARLLPSAAGLETAPDSKVIAFYINMRELRQARTFLSKEAERG